MYPLAILASLMAVGIATTAAAEPPVQGFQYVGCVEAKSSDFPVTITFFAAFRSSDCPPACAGTGSSYAALGGNCHCSDPEATHPIEYTVVDEAKCSKLCLPKDESAGHCGGPRQEGPYENGDLQYYNLYQQMWTDAVINE